MKESRNKHKTDVIRAEETADEISPEKFIAFIENIPDYIALHDKKGNYVYLNHYAKGYTKEETIGKHYTIYLPEDSKKIYRKHFNAAKKTGKTQYIEYFAPGDDEVVKYYESYIVPLFEKGKFVNMMVIARDISEKKAFENSLKESEANARAIMESTSDTIILIDKKGYVLDTNEGHAKRFGLKREEIIGKNMKDFLPDNLYKTRFKNIKKCLETGNQVFGEDFRDNRYSEFGIYPIKINKKKPDRVSVFSRDITDRKNLIEELERIKDFSENLLQTANTIIVGLDINGRVSLLNGAGEKITGYKIEEIKGLDWFELLVPKDRFPEVWKTFDKITTGTEVKNFENPIITKSGEERYVLWQNNMMFEHGKMTGTLSFGIDITERKALEEEAKSSYTLLNIAGRTAKFGGWSVALPSYKVIWSEEVSNIHDVPDGYIPTVEKGIDFYEPEYRETIRKLFTDCVNIGKPYDAELQIITAKGKKLWVRAIGEAERDADGKIIKVYGGFQDISEQKKAEEELRNSENKFRLLFDDSPSILFLIQEDGKFYSANKAAVNRYGYTADEFRGLTPMDIALPENKEKAADKLATALREGSHFEWIHCSKDGTSFPVEIFTKPIRINDRSFIFVEVSDITKRKQAENELRLSEEKFRKAFLSNPGIACISTIDEGEFIDVNEKFCKSIGWKSEEVIGKTSKELNIFEDNQIRDKFISLVNKNGFVNDFELRIRTRSGEIKDTLYAAERIVMDNKECILSQVVDITERKRAEEALKENEELYHALFEKNTAIKLLIDPKDGAIVDANSAASEYYGYPHDKLTKMRISDINTLTAAELAEEMQKVLLEKKSYFNFKHKLFNGSIRDVEVYSSPIHIKGRTLLQSIVHDITERKRTEELLKKSENNLREINAAKDKFFNIIAHDLRSPFSSILGFSSLLDEQMEAKDYEGIEEYASYIHKSATHAMSLLENLLNWSRSQTGKMEFKPEYIDLKELLDEALLSLNDVSVQKTISIKTKTDKNVPVIADRTMTGIILRNLISNAIKFSHPGGEIFVSAEQNPNEILVSVKDGGVGITREDMTKLFRIDTNHTTLGTNREKGTGLGLLLCKEFIEKHGGKIWVESEEGKGSTFYFTLPKNWITG